MAAGVLTGMTSSLLCSMLVVLISQHHALSTASTSQGPPTPQLPLDVYTDPFTEDSLGLPSAFVCICVCVCARLPWATTQLVCTEPCGVTTPGLFPSDHSHTLRARGPTSERVDKDKWSFRPEPP